MLSTAQSPFSLGPVDSAAKVTDFLDTSDPYFPQELEDVVDLFINQDEIDLGGQEEVSTNNDSDRQAKKRRRLLKKERREKKAPVQGHTSSICSSGAPILKLRKKSRTLLTEDISRVEDRSVASSLSVSELQKPRPVAQPVPCISPVKTPTGSPSKRSLVTSPSPVEPVFEENASDEDVYQWALAHATARQARDGPPLPQPNNRVVLNDLAHRREYHTAC